jgi:hypothetical protein
MSLCTLIQRVGRAARKFDVEATGVYLVEKEHFDAYKAAQAAKKKVAEKKRRKAQGGPSAKTPRTTGTADASQARQEAEDSDNSGDESDGSPEDLTRIPSVAPAQLGRLLPSRAGISMEDYEKAVMDVYINTRSHGICRRDVTNEYFDNPLGKTDFNPHLTSLGGYLKLQNHHLVTVKDIVEEENRDSVVISAILQISYYGLLLPQRRRSAERTRSRPRSIQWSSAISIYAKA